MLNKPFLSLFLVCALIFSAGCETMRHAAAEESDAVSAPPELFFETYWQLVELKGEPFYSNLGHEREPHIIFQELDSRVFGSGGCNRFMGGFTLFANDRIRLSKLASTMMACPNLEQEQAFLRALESADKFVLSQNKLTLKDSQGKPAARFQATKETPPTHR